MLKRKLRANIDSIVSVKRRQTESRLDVLFEQTAKPTTVEEALSYLKGLVDWRKFCSKVNTKVLRDMYNIIYVGLLFGCCI